MLISKKPHDSALFKNVLKLIKANHTSKQAKLLSEFAFYFFNNITSSDIEVRTPETLYEPLICLWEFIQQHNGKSCVKVFSPTEKNDGWSSQHSIIQLLHGDMPFLVDSIRMELNRMGISVHLHIHMPMTVVSDKNGKIKEFHRPGESEYISKQTPMCIEIDRQLAQSDLDIIKSNIEEVLLEVSAAVSDWKPMCERLDQAICHMTNLPKKLQSDKNLESRDFLDWISANHFTLLGYTYYELKDTKAGKKLTPKKDTFLGLNLLERWKPKAYKLSDIPKGARHLILKTDNLLVLTKLSAVSRVHRPAHLDYVGVKRVNARGEIIGEDRFIGLYTSAAYNINPMNIPVLRQKILVVQKESGLSNYEHDRKVLKNILETYPRDELFQTGYANLLETSMGILQMQERPIIRMFARRDPYGRFFSCLVYVPREIYNTKIRLEITEILRNSLQANGAIRFTTTFSDSVLSRIHFVVPVENAEKIKVDIPSIEKEMQQASRSWAEHLTEALLVSFGEAEGKRLSKRYHNVFPAGYQEDYESDTAITDIKHLESLSEENELSMLLYSSVEDDEEKIKLKLYYRNKPKPLSEIMPMLENMGLKVIGETPFRVRPQGGVNRWISDFEMKHAGGEKLNLNALQDKFQDALRQIWLGEAENDGFNRLVLSASLDWRETALLRAYAKYKWQIGSSFSQQYVEETLAAYPNISRLIVDYFYQKFNPEIERDSRKETLIYKKIVSSLENVSNLDQDRILNRYLELITVTVRTNFFSENGRR
ncbi:MAG: NAD-glutamate dehydrogenase [Enterobacterales bacterium]|nr:NAD-glutamate dehydrogenase [Enterobacterales bacterium]